MHRRNRRCTEGKDLRDHEEAPPEGRYNDRLLPLANACFVEVNPIPVKEAMNLLGFDAGAPRAPLTRIEDGNREKLASAMKTYGLEIKA